MKVFALLLMFSCYYNDLCPRQRMLDVVNAKIKAQVELVKTIDPMDDRFEQAEEYLFDLLIEKAEIEDIKCYKH